MPPFACYSNGKADKSFPTFLAKIESITFRNFKKQNRIAKNYGI
jgi:hypothetical protein